MSQNIPDSLDEKMAKLFERIDAKTERTIKRFDNMEMRIDQTTRIIYLLMFVVIAGCVILVAPLWRI